MGGVGGVGDEAVGGITAEEGVGGWATAQEGQVKAGINEPEPVRPLPSRPGQRR